MAISAGHLSLVATWESEDTNIELACTGENFDITLRVRYGSKVLKKLQEDTSEAEKMSDL